MLMYLYLLLLLTGSKVSGYSRPFFTLTNVSVDYFDLKCIPPPQALLSSPQDEKPNYRTDKNLKLSAKIDVARIRPTKTVTQVYTTTTEEDPSIRNENLVHMFLYGPQIEDRKPLDQRYVYNSAALDNKEHKLSMVEHNEFTDDEQSSLIDIYPDGGYFRAELFNQKVGAHLPPQELHHPGHCRLNTHSKDKMQTALNAFAIFLYCSSRDIERLPADYILRSARTIAMMKIAREKLAATWRVVKGNRKTEAIPYHVLEMYRPLFKYLDGREMARLNLSDPKILTFIGTHADLTRHQVGIIASRYVKITPNWLEAKNLNLMNNLLCGMPMNLMRKASSNVYLQFTQQLFYHIRACDSLQRSFYLNLLTRTEALGRSNSWSARDVARLGLLLAELQGPDFAAINPKAMSGITAQVMLKIPPEVLQYVTETQLRYLAEKPLNILARKLKDYQDKQLTFGLTADYASIKIGNIFLLKMCIVYLKLM